ncbi:MAG: hypothetical protein GYA51_12995 [Candidatus Methanofastidiosa archaeon]|nr:hypothetical protein [Candidatus Methanofastidiosa archaeon]
MMDFKVDEESDKKDNEKCFLKNKQKIKYNSFTLLEIFPLEKINHLIDGLDKLYEGAYFTDDSRYNYRDILRNMSKNLFVSQVIPFPPIINVDFDCIGLPRGVCYDLGDNITYYTLSLNVIMPSLVVLKINVYLNENISNKLNDIIYKYHKTNIDTVKDFTTKKILSPETVKYGEIYDFRASLRSEAINFISNYFKGYFFEEIKRADNSVVPYIDTFSLKYPMKYKEIVMWKIQNKEFFRCFGLSINNADVYSNNFLLSFEEGGIVMKARFNNYLLFANTKKIQNSLHFLLKNKNETISCIDYINDEIEGIITEYPFELFAISRWLEIQEKYVGEFFNSISKEFTNINENKLELSIDIRKKISNIIFQFQRFKTEYKLYMRYEYRKDFHCIYEDDDDFKYFSDLKNRINERINDIDELIFMYTNNSDSIITLKNIEYNKNIQDGIYVLTFFIIILTIIQIIFSFYGEHLLEIINIIFYLIKLIITLFF